MLDTVAEIVIAVVGSNAIFSFIQFMVQRADTKKNVEKKIDNLSEAFEEHKATLARTHILRFADEQRSGMVHHSKEYFEQQIQDIDTYEKYCELHPGFKNGLTVMASQYIKSEYKRIYLSND
jgi:hypothetical protein